MMNNIMYSNISRINLGQGALQSFYVSKIFFEILTSSSLLHFLESGN